MSTSISRRRARADIESDDEGDRIRRSQSSTPSESSKRARINGNHNDQQSDSPEPEPPRVGIVRKGKGRAQNGGDGDEGEADPTGFQPGAIIRVKLRNFVTYESAEFFPGPSMNMVIGPNGTGKSSLVCAICIGLGWGTINLGRAKDFGEYVKHNTKAAEIEIELQKRPKETENHVIRVRITKDGNTRDWWLNDRKASLKVVQKLVRDFYIQIDNLCQFLPQEKVAEFAALSPIDLLRETQRAAAPPQMLEWHESLKDLRKTQKTLNMQLVADREQLASWETRQQNLHSEVLKLKERDAILKKINHLEKTIPWVEYRVARDAYKVRSQIKKEAQRRLRELQAEEKPTMDMIHAKEQYSKQISRVIAARKVAATNAEREADQKAQALEKLVEDIKQYVVAHDAQKGHHQDLKTEIGKKQQIITKLKSRLHDEQIDFDGPAWNERIRAKENELRNISTVIQELQATNQEKTLIGKELRGKIDRDRMTLKAFDTQQGQQLNKLERVAKETAIAWKWIQDNRDQFQEEVYGPPLVTCSLKDPRYANAVEVLLGKADFLAFTTQNLNDMTKLMDQLVGAMGLSDVTVRSASGKNYDRRELSAQDLQRLGLDGWAIDFIDGPGPVLNMLCDVRRLEKSPVGLQESNEESYNEIVAVETVTHWVSGPSFHQVSRRKEYGPEAFSTTAKHVPEATNWTDQPVDTAAKREVQERIDAMEGEFEELKRVIKPIRSDIEQKRGELPELKEEIKRLTKEKGEMQKLHNERLSLPTKIEREEGLLKQKHAGFAEIREETHKINVQHDHAVMRKSSLALQYRDLVKKIRACHEAVVEAMVMSIEAESDVAGLKERNVHIVRQLEEEQQKLADAQRELNDFKKIAEKALVTVTAIQADDENAEHLDGWRDLPRELTVEQLEGEILTETTKLEFVVASNPNAANEYNKRQADVERLSRKVAEVDEKLETMDGKIAEIRQQWEPELDELISEISDALTHNFSQIGCAGEVSVHKDEDFDLWAIQIKVKFRENEDLQILDSHRQSGGERSVSTIFFLMSLQSLAQAPFRVVDEINQGMDPRNERMVHERMVEIACKEHTSQYFLITPKLLTGLRYDRRMKVLCIASGAWMPENYKKLDVSKVIGIKRSLMAAA
ncbi:related to structural maintenance of chromosome protein (SMC) [Rhynchosporium agropyri]|uniref:Structural maintenance of chromosomes protein 5 n=1 Tax=Rhynchosporium agropyri TaxID=914238 RepID=A0A1E1L540_9HELO|nr:related to structural maintenance of chromosome protein (SMC) [Rhynchosporium agropyri]